MRRNGIRRIGGTDIPRNLAKTQDSEPDAMPEAMPVSLNTALQLALVIRNSVLVRPGKFSESHVLICVGMARVLYCVKLVACPLFLFHTQYDAMSQTGQRDVEPGNRSGMGYPSPPFIHFHTHIQ